MKRLLDITVSSILLLLLSPVVLAVSLISLLVQGSPVLFSQERPGKHGVIFTIRKFRTMASGNGTDAQRLTKWGKFLRKTSLDELPQLWNILKGEMSLVGPRPLLVEYLPLYSKEQARRHDVTPGLTGWAQVKGRNAITWEEKFGYDVWYVDNRSFLLDLKILGLTVLKVLRRSDINHEDSATMENFKGTPLEVNNPGGEKP
jgi:lipopolysaccharide/colanic/teichoic acid biosynthesis glycosyltransferase